MSGEPPVQLTVESELPFADRNLVDAVLAGDRKATAQFVDLHADLVYRYIYHRLDLPEAAEDLVQEVFLAAWTKLRHFRGECELGTWLIGIARHKISDYYREKFKNFESVDEMSEESELQAVAISPDLDQCFDCKELEARARTVLADLSQLYRAVLVWCYWDQCSLAEMAEIAGKTPKSMERLLARAREQFKLRWEHE